MKTIIFYIHSLVKNGAERVLITIADEIAKQGEYKVIILTDIIADSEYLVPNNVDRLSIDSLNSHFLLLKRNKRLERLYLLRKISLEKKADVIIAFMGGGAKRMLVATWALTLPKIIAIRSDPYSEYTNPLKIYFTKLLFNRANRVIFQTKVQQQFFQKSIQKKSDIIMNPISPSFCIPPYNGIRRKEIVASGRLEPEKNHILLINAFAKIAAAYPDYCLTIYGEGTLRCFLEQHIASLGLSQRISLPGNISDVVNKLKDVSLFVMTSTYEGLPNSLIEVMALGLPVISTNFSGGGAQMLIENEVNGFLIPMNDEKALVSKMDLLLSNPALAKTLGDSASNIQKTLEISSITSQWIANIKAVVK